METRAHHILVGLFTVVITIASMWFAMWFGKMGSKYQYADYDIEFHESVSGLAKGASAEFNGIKVGEVTDIRIDQQNPRLVYARIRIQGNTPIRTDTQASLAPMGITGSSQISLSSGTNPQSQPLLPKDKEVPVIVATPSTLSQLMGSGGDMVKEMNNLMTRANRLFSDENIESLSKTIANLEKMSTALAGEGESNNIENLVKQLEQTVRQANTTLASVDKLARTGNHLVQSDGQQLLASANHSIQSFEKSMKVLETTLQNNQNSLNSGMQGLAELGPTLDELRSTLKSVKGVMRQLEDQPANYLFSREQMKEFKP